jgi:hypothetical protein
MWEREVTKDTSKFALMSGTFTDVYVEVHVRQIIEL